MSSHQLGDIDKYISDLTPDSKDLINLEELVICFDDLDRKSESLSLTDFYGYVNYMVESFGIKIIIISNEHELEEKDKREAAKLKEKVIGVHINYKPNIDITFNSILNKRYKQNFSVYYNFLLNNKNIILNTLKINRNNFRSLIFFLEHFKLVFSSLEEVFQRDKKFKYKKREKQEAVLVCSLALAFEFKSGNLKKKEIEELEKTSNECITDLSLAIFKLEEKQNNNQETEKEETLIQKLKRLYSSTKDFYLFKSIILYFLGFNTLDKEGLIKELRQQFPSDDDILSKWQKVLNKLTNRSYLDLGDKEYKELTDEMLSYVDLGKYALHQYGTIFYCVTRHNNLLEFDLATLQERLMKGIDKGREHYDYTPTLDFRMEISRDAEFPEAKKKIVNYCVEVNEELKKDQEKEVLESLFSLFKTNLDEFRIKTASTNSEFGHLACWQFFKPEECVSVIKNMLNTDIFELSLYFKNRPLHFAQNEKDCLQKIEKLLEKYIKKVDDKLKIVVMEKLIIALNSLIKKIESGKNRE